MLRFTRGKGLFGAVDVSGAITSVSGAFSGALRGRKNVSAKRAASTIADGASMVATAAHIMTDTIVSATPTAARNVTTDTATAIVALAVGYAVGDTTEFTVINLNATNALTIVGGTGVTIVGSAVVALSTSATFYIRIASATAVVLYRKD